MFALDSADFELKWLQQKVEWKGDRVLICHLSTNFSPKRVISWLSYSLCLRDLNIGSLSQVPPE
jgi:hypothetical protein